MLKRKCRPQAFALSIVRIALTTKIRGPEYRWRSDRVLDDDIVRPNVALGEKDGLVRVVGRGLIMILCLSVVQHLKLNESAERGVL